MDPIRGSGELALESCGLVAAVERGEGRAARTAAGRAGSGVQTAVRAGGRAGPTRRIAVAGVRAGGVARAAACADDGARASERGRRGGALPQARKRAAWRGRCLAAAAAQLGGAGWGACRGIGFGGGGRWAGWA